METYCNSECDESLDVSVEDEEEDEDEPQEGQQLTNRCLKNLNQNSGRRKAKSPDTMDIDQSEDSGLTWETSSSRCSTSQASETSATSGVSSMNNSNMDSPPGKVMEERITEQKTRNSLDQMPSFADQNTGMGSKKQAFSLRQASSQPRELDLADPLSWPYQVQPSKIKEYLIQITQEVETPLVEEKENSLKKKGELPLKGTVRARIEQITAVLEERNKRIFRRVNGKDMPPAVIEKPKEPPKIFSRQGISVSLRHVERDTRNKDKKKEILHYNLKPVQTNISKPGVPAPYKQDERKTRKSVLPETPTKASEKPSPTLPPLANKANKLENESYLPVPQTSVLEHTRFAPPDHQDKEEKKAKQSFLPDAARVIAEKSAGLVDKTEQQTTEQDLPVATEAPHVSEAPRSTPERKTAQPGSPVPDGPLSYSTNEAENQTKSTVVVPSESAAQDVPYPNIMKSESVQHEHGHSLSAETASQDTELHPSQPEIKDMASLHSAEETRKQDIPPYSPAASLTEQVESPHSVMETVKQETNELEVDYLKKEDLQTQPTTTLQTEPDHIHTLHSEEVSEAREAEMVPDFSSTGHRTEIQERPSTEEHLGLPQLSHLMGEAEKEEKEQLELNLEKQGVQTQTPVTASLESECQEVSSARDKAENQTIQLEFQQTRPSFPTPTVQWEEVHQHSVATVQSESEQPVISEPVTTLQGSEHRESSHLRDTEVSPYSPTEIRDETSEQLPSISSLFDSVEKQETQPPSLRTAIPLSEQPNSVLPQVPEQMEERGNLLCSPEKATLISEVPLPTAAVQNADMPKLDIQPDSTTKAPSEELVSISSESAVAERKTVQLDLPLSAEPSPEPAVQLQEAAELQNHASPSIKADLYSEVQGASCHNGDDNKERDQHLFATTQLEDKDSVMSETKEQNLKTRDSMPLELEVEAGIALSSADEADNKIMHKSISEPSQTDSVGPMHVPEKQERVHLGTEQTPQLLSPTNLQKESNVSCAVEEGAIKGIYHYVPATAKDLSESVCSTGPQDAADFSTGAAAPDSGLLTTPNSEAMTHDIAAPISEYVTMQPLEAAVVELQPAYVQVSPSTSESRKHFDVSFPVLGAEEEDRIMIPQSDSDHQVQSEAEGKGAEHYSPMTPTSSAATESQRSQGPSSSEAPKQSLKIPSFLGDTESLVSSVLASEQSDFLLSDWNNKAEKEEIQAPFPKKPETVPEEPLSITAFLLGETREESLHSSRAVNIVPKESKAIPEDDISEAVKETAPSFSPVSEEHLTKETFSSFVAEAGEEQDWSRSLVTEESKQLAAEKADVHDDESHLPASQDVNLYCPVTAESELDNRTFLNSTEGISKEEGPQHLLSTVQSAPIYQELLYHGEERDSQERIPLETKHSKSLQSPILQQESEHLDLRQPIKELEMEAIQPYSSAAIQDLSLLAGEKGTSELQDDLPKMEEVDFGVSKTSESVDEAKKKEIQPPSSEELEPCASSLLTGIWEEQGIRSPSPEASTSAVLGQLTSASMDFTEKAKEPKVQPCPPVRVLPEEPLSIASFLLSEAKEMQTSLPKTAQKENLDSQLPFKESDLLVEGSRSISACPPDTDVAMKREIQPSLIHVETEQLSHDLQPVFTDQGNRENIHNIPTVPNLMLNESSDKITNKAIVISTENIAEKEEIKNLPHADVIRKEPENYLQKEKELKDNEKSREKATTTGEPDQAKDISSNSEDYVTVTIHAPPPASSVDKEENMYMPEKLNDLETVSSLQTKAFNLAEDLVGDQKISMCKPGTESLETAGFENKESELKELVREADIQGTHDLQPVFNDQDMRENICNIPTITNSTLNESSDTVPLEPRNGTQPRSAVSDKTTNKAIVISTENIAGKEEIKNVPHADVIRKEPENDLQKEKELKDNEKTREKAKTTGELDQGKDMSSNSEDYATVTIHVPPPVSSVDKEENMHMPEKLNDLETVSSLQTKAFNLAEDLVGDQKISMCKPGTESLETAGFENKESELKELVREADIQGTHDLQPVFNDQDMRENICNIPTITNSTLNESSDTVPLEPRNGTQPWSAVSDKTTNKAIVISTENIAGKEEIKNVPHADVIRKEPENDLQKEKELKDNEKTREKATTTGELDQGKDMSSNSEDYATVTIHVPPPVSSVDKEENKHMPEKLNDLETISSLQTKMFNLAEDLVVDQKISMCKSGTDSLETADIENKESELKELVREADIQVNIHNEKEILAVPGNKTDGILNASGLDYFEKITVTDDASFTQAGKELSVQEAQMPLDVTKENVEETPSPAASLENILEFSLLESTLDKKFNGIARKENATTSTHKGMSKVLKEDKLVDVVRKNDKNIEEEINLVGATLFDVEKVMLSQTPSIPLPDSTVNPEFTVGRPALASWNRDVYENAGLDSKEDSCKHLSDENIKNTYDAPSDEITAYFEGGIAKDDSPNNLEDSQRKQVLKDQHLKEEPELLQGPYESNEKEHEPTYILAEASSQAGVLSPREIVKGMNDALIERPAEISSDVKVVTCQPLHAIPFGSRLYHSGATSDENSQNRAEESSSSETSQMLPEETSDEESSPILDYAATVYPKESSVQDDSKDVTCLATDQTQQPERTEVDEAEHDVVRKPVEEATSSHETFFHVSSQQQNEGQLEGQLASVLEPVAQGPYALDHEHLPSLDFDGQTYKKSIGENIITDLAKQNREDANQPLSASGAKSDKAFGELDFSLLSHDFDSYPLYSIKEEEYSDDEDLAELMEYEIVTQDDVFQKETPSEEACEEGFLDDRKSLDPISDSYEFVNEKEGNTYAEEEERMDVEKFLENVPENEVLQGETELAQLDTYCCECRCPISADDKLWGGHRDHSVTNLDTGVTELKGQLDGFMDVLQERSLKIEESVSEIEALFNTLEENCKGKEQLLEEQNENIVKTVLAHHDQTAQRFEEIKSTKLEYLYEQMVIFQEYIDTAKETLEIIVKETEEMDDCAFLRSSEELNKRLLSAVEDILTSEKMPTAFSHFEHFAGNSASGAWTLESVPVPQTPKLQPQEPNSATSTSIAIYWTVSEEDVIDFFQVYCMEENPGRQEQSGLVEEYRVTVKESNCILEDLEPGHCYSVWIMAVNYTGCSFPSEKSTFRTAPPTPVIKAEDCTVCWDTATIRWSTGNPGATDSFTLEYCRQYSPEGEGLRSLAGIKRPELKVNLEPNINYFFYVRAVNAFGTSEQSEAALISTKGTRFHLMKEAAHPALQVSPNGTMICLPKETQITGISPVWGELLSSQGRHYWEVTVTGCEAYKIGICYSTILPDGILGQNDSSWCLYCSSKTSLVYKVLHKGEMSDVIVTEHPAQIGVLLDYNAGRLLFFNAERGQVLFGIRRKFTAAAHPAFGLEQPGILHLHTGMELPEFVDHS